MQAAIVVALRVGFELEADADIVESVEIDCAWRVWQVVD